MSIPAGFKAMLAAPLTKPEALAFPVIVSPKIDGIRCVVFGGVAYAGRSMKRIRNRFVQKWAYEHEIDLEGLDGELVVGSPTDPNCMQNTTSGVMREHGEPDFMFFVFDSLQCMGGLAAHLPFQDRVRCAEDACFNARANTERIEAVPQHRCIVPVELDNAERHFVGRGFEGMMVRSPDAPYKFGRSTEREAGLLKVKRFSDAEAVVVGFEEEMHNGNEATKDARGNTERSTAKAGLTGKGTLGALVVKDISTSVEFSVGSGFTAQQRADFWEGRYELVGSVVKYKYFAHGVKEAPRHPVFVGFRDREDM